MGLNDQKPPETRYIKVFIGRFQPFHNGHLKVLRAAIDTANLVVVVIGSAQAIHRTYKNPFTDTERKDMILLSLTPAERSKVVILGQQDMPGKDKEWVTTIKARVRFAAEALLGLHKFRFTLIGCHKDASSYYLKLYKGWGLDLIPQNEAMNATDVRREFFAPQIKHVDGVPAYALTVPPATAGFLLAFRSLNHYDWVNLANEFRDNDPQQKIMR